jgi:hypothetical protein
VSDSTFKDLLAAVCCAVADVENKHARGDNWGYEAAKKEMEQARAALIAEHERVVKDHAEIKKRIEEICEQDSELTKLAVKVGQDRDRLAAENAELRAPIQCAVCGNEGAFLKIDFMSNLILALVICLDVALAVLIVWIVTREN